MLNTETIQPLIDNGEGYNVEFKVRVPSKVRELTEEIWHVYTNVGHIHTIKFYSAINKNEIVTFAAK